jgi:carbon monoxide dehydrogenase subunit G
MLIESEFEVAAPLEQVWKHMQDVPRIAPCLRRVQGPSNNQDGAGKVAILRYRPDRTA